MAGKTISNQKAYEFDVSPQKKALNKRSCKNKWCIRMLFYIEKSESGKICFKVLVC